MKFVIAGLGSIGRRHLRNLLRLGERDLVLYRTGHSTLAEEDLQAFPSSPDLAGILAGHPDAVLVCNPTALHMPVALAAARAGCDVFLEKPVSHDLEGVEPLRAALRQSGRQAMVGFQFRFHPGLRAIAGWLRESAVGGAVSARAHWGEYLPDWHAGEDYRLSYAARRELGGGALLTMCHPFDYLRWLLGEVDSVSARSGRSGALELDVEDVAEVSLGFVSGAIGSVHLDYLQRPPTHTLEIVGDAGTIRWDAADGAARLYRGASDAWVVVSPPAGYDRNGMFLDEMRHFLSVVRREEPPACTLEDGIRALQIALEAKRHSETDRSA
jgi:predicted dehydrogenase